MIVTIKPKLIVFNRKIPNLCRRPYQGHPKGCPNHGKKESCPPRRPLINEVFDFRRELYVIYTEFAVGEFAEKLRRKHRDKEIWRKHPAMWYNPRLWQGRARKMQREEEARFLSEHEGLIVNGFPEAHGVNVTELMRSVGVELDWREWPPPHVLKGKNYLENTTYRVSMGGTSK